MVVPAISHGELTPLDVIDLKKLSNDWIVDDPHGLRVGSMASYQQLLGSDLVRNRVPLLWRVASGITGGIQIRSQGTLGGAACAARPHSDAPAVLVALGAELMLRSQAGTRSVAASEFFLGAEAVDINRNEYLEEIVFPASRVRSSFGYHKLKFAEGSWPIATASSILSNDPTVKNSYSGIVLGGVSEVPIVISVEGLVNADPSPTELREHLRERIASANSRAFWNDVLAEPHYREVVASEVAFRAFSEALDRKENSQ